MIFYTRLKNVPHFSTKLSEMLEPWAKRLIAIAQMLDNGEFTRGKVEWLSPFPQFDFSVGKLILSFLTTVQLHAEDQV